jgi:hypothetical protein
VRSRRWSDETSSWGAVVVLAPRWVRGEGKDLWGSPRRAWTAVPSLVEPGGALYMLIDRKGACVLAETRSESRSLVFWERGRDCSVLRPAPLRTYVKTHRREDQQSVEEKHSKEGWRLVICRERSLKM